MKIDQRLLRTAMMPESRAERQSMDENAAALNVALQRIAILMSVGEKFAVFAIDERGNPINTRTTY